MIDWKSPLSLLFAALLLGATMSMTACGDDSSSDDGGDGDGDMSGDGDGDGDGDGPITGCDLTPCEGMMVFGFPAPTCCQTADTCGLDATALGMGCVDPSLLDQIPSQDGGTGDAGM